MINTKFDIVENNDVLIRIQAKLPDGSLIPGGIGGMAIKWQAFNAAGQAFITKSTALGGDDQITITDAENCIFSFWLKAADTKGKGGAGYIHEAVTVDASGHPVTLTNNDALLSAGRIMIRKQYTVQD